MTTVKRGIYCWSPFIQISTKGKKTKKTNKQRTTATTNPVSYHCKTVSITCRTVFRLKYLFGQSLRIVGLSLYESDAKFCRFKYKCISSATFTADFETKSEFHISSKSVPFLYGICFSFAVLHNPVFHSFLEPLVIFFSEFCLPLQTKQTKTIPKDWPLHY